jgi:hypothetical protein
MPCHAVNCNLHHEFEWAHMRREQLLRTLDKLDDIRFNQMGLLESRVLIQNKYEEERKEIRKVDQRIIRVCTK